MSSDARMLPAPRARAVAGAPVDALLARADELARRWAIALILALPPERIGEFPLESFARQAPLLCAHVVRALQSDAELQRIAPGAAEGREPSPASRLAEVTGARDGKAAVEAVEALRGVLWDALLDEMRWHGFDQSPAREVADLADRLAYVCSSALVSSLAQPAQAAQAAPAQAGAHGEAAQAGAQAAAAQAGAQAAPAQAGGRAEAAQAGAQVRAQVAHVRAEPAVPSADREPVVGRSQRSPLGNGVAIVDEGPRPDRRRSRERGHRAEDAAGAPPDSTVTSPTRAGARRRRARALPWDTPLRGDPAGPLEEPE